MWDSGGDARADLCSFRVAGQQQVAGDSGSDAAAAGDRAWAGDLQAACGWSGRDDRCRVASLCGDLLYDDLAGGGAGGGSAGRVIDVSACQN